MKVKYRKNAIRPQDSHRQQIHVCTSDKYTNTNLIAICHQMMCGYQRLVDDNPVGVLRTLDK